MKGRDLLKRTPFRLAATFSIVIATVFVALFAVLYLGISARLENDIKDRVLETAAALAALDDQKKFNGLIEAVASESDSVRDSDFIFELVDNDGQFLAGNVRGVTPSASWLTLKRSDIFLTVARGELDDRFSAIWTTLSKGRLLVGSSNREVRQTQDYLMAVFGYGLLATGLIIAAVGFGLAVQAQNRIRVFAETLSAISHGHVSARVPMLGSGDDIDQVASQVNGTLEHLQGLIENVNQSSSDIAHDLKKPIGRLRQRLELLNSSPSTESEMREALNNAIQDIDSITETFDALLRITQIEAGARKSRFAAVDLNAVLENVHDVYAAVAEDAGDTLTLDAPPSESHIISGDADLLTQLFANLIENALNHCPAGTQIAIGLRNINDNSIIVSVSDSGPGIPEGERRNVFRRLYRLERARSSPGHGLGLSLVSAVADLHGARVTLSDNAPGLHVAIEFPALRPVKPY